MKNAAIGSKLRRCLRCNDESDAVGLYDGYDLAAFTGNQKLASECSRGWQLVRFVGADLEAGARTVQWGKGKLTCIDVRALFIDLGANTNEVSKEMDSALADEEPFKVFQYNVQFFSR